MTVHEDRLNLERAASAFLRNRGYVIEDAHSYWASGSSGKEGSVGWMEYDRVCEIYYWAVFFGIQDKRWFLGMNIQYITQYISYVEFHPPVGFDPSGLLVGDFLSPPAIESSNL